MKNRFFATLLSILLLFALLPIGSTEALMGVTYDAATDTLNWEYTAPPAYYMLQVEWGSVIEMLAPHLSGELTSLPNFSDYLYAFGFYGQVKIWLTAIGQSGTGFGCAAIVNIPAPADSIVLATPVCTASCDHRVHWDAVPNADQYVVLIQYPSGSNESYQLANTTTSYLAPNNTTVSVYAQARTSPYLSSGYGAVSVDDSVPHTVSAYTTVTEPTCTAAGSESGVCSVCSRTITREIPALAHAPAAYADIPATCTEAGQTGGMYCTVCGVQLSAPTVIPALGHDPAYVSNGDCTHTVTCSRCDEVLEANAPCTPVDHVCTLCGGYVFVKGDVTLDEHVTAQDAAALMRYIVGLDALTEIKLLAANVDGGSLTSSDAACILRYVVNSAW